MFILTSDEICLGKFCTCSGARYIMGWDDATQWSARSAWECINRWRQVMPKKTQNQSGHRSIHGGVFDA